MLSALGQFSLQFTVLPGQAVQRRRKLLLHRSFGFGNEVPSKRFNSFIAQTESAPLQ